MLSLTVVGDQHDELSYVEEQTIMSVSVYKDMKGFLFILGSFDKVHYAPSGFGILDPVSLFIS